MSRKKRLSSDAYDKQCLYRRSVEAAEEDIDSGQIYKFAIEFPTLDEFLSEFSMLTDLYLFFDKGGKRTPQCSAELEEGLDCAENNRLCQRCFKYYATLECYFIEFVAKRNCVQIWLENKEASILDRCPRCGQKLYARKCVSVVISLYDLRLLGRPSKLLINWKKHKCSSCNNYLEDSVLYGFMPSERRTFSCRLTEAILYAQLSGIKREYIAEAYGVPAANLNRVKKAMLEQSREFRLSLAYKHIISNLAPINIVAVPFADDIYPQSHPIAYFWVQDNSIKLINVLSKFERDSLTRSNWKTNSLFSCTKEEFILNCFCVLTTEFGLQGDVLHGRLIECEQVFDRYSDIDVDRGADYFFSRVSPGMDPFNDISRLLNSFPLHAKSQLLILDSGQLVLNGFFDAGFFINPGLSAGLNAIDRLITVIEKALWEKGRIRWNALKNILLYFNPAVVSETEIIQFSGTKTNNDVYSFGEGKKHEAFWGVDISCLDHFISGGLLDPDNQSIIPCNLLNKALQRENVADNTTPICGLARSSCPHIKNC